MVLPYFLQYKSEFGNKEFMIWGTVSSQSSFCCLYRASPSLAAKNLNLNNTKKKNIKGHINKVNINTYGFPSTNYWKTSQNVFQLHRYIYFCDVLFLFVSFLLYWIEVYIWLLKCPLLKDMPELILLMWISMILHI